MRPQARHFLAQVLYALCGIWVAIAPVAPQIHQSSAKHRHVYCFEHNRIEDEAGIEPHDRFTARAWHPETTTISGALPLTKAGISGIECLFSNFLAHALSCTSGRTMTGFLSAELPRPILGECVPRSVETYRIAPKTSPPASV